MKNVQTKVKEENNTPIKTFRTGTVSVSVWKNEGLTKENKEYEFYSVTSQRSYTDKDNTWQKTNSMRTIDLPKLILCLNEAYKYISFISKENEEE